MVDYPPFAEEWLAIEKAQGGRFQLSGDVNDQREQFKDMVKSLEPMLTPPSATIKTQDVQMPNGKRIRVYNHTGVAEPMPVGFYIHCGGGYLGSVEGEDHLIRDIVERTKRVLFSADYGLAPEAPFPKGLEDNCFAYEWLNLGLLPPTYLAITTKDPTHQEAIFFYEELKKKGVAVTKEEFVGWPHFFHIFPFITEHERFQKIWCDSLSKMIEDDKAA